MMAPRRDVLVELSVARGGQETRGWAEWMVKLLLLGRESR